MSIRTNLVIDPGTAVLMRAEFLQLGRVLEKKYSQDSVMRTWRTVWLTVSRKISTMRTF